MIRKLFPDVSISRPGIKFILLMLGFVFLAAAVCGPLIGSKLEEVKRKGADIIIALDVSNSMKAEDIKPNRLERSKQAISRLIDKLQGDRIGLVVFAGDAYMQLPITTDYGAAKLFLSTVEPDIVPRQGTAIGAAIGSTKPTVLITGDVGFLYDSNALWNNYIPKNFKIILINNGGGGIFRILPGHKETETFNTYFETSHCLTAEHLAKMYQFDYATASNEATLSKGLNQLFAQNKTPMILEVFTPTRENDKLLLNYFKALV